MKLRALPKVIMALWFLPTVMMGEVPINKWQEFSCEFWKKIGESLKDGPSPEKLKYVSDKGLTA